jgi:hypothetical protein
MNESDRKFFLKNFFSFNVSSSVNSSFNNEANNELDEEADEESTSLNKSSTRVVDNIHHSETNNFSKLRINSLNEMKKASFEESVKLIEAPPPPTTQPSSSVITMPDSISETPTTTESNENNKIRKQLKRQSKKVSQNHVETVEFSDMSQTNALKQSQSQSPPLIKISNCKDDDEKLISHHAKTNNINLLQQQQSIELKPFKKKEVHISDSLEIDHYMSQSSEEKILLNGASFSQNNSLSANYDSLSNSFNNSIKSDISRFNTTLTTLSSTEDVNLKNSQNTNANNNNNNNNDDSFMIKNSVELMGQRPASNLALFEKSLTDSQNVYIKQMNSFLNSPSASARLSLTPKFISIRYRLEVAF